MTHHAIFLCMIGCKDALSDAENLKITQGRYDNLSIMEIAKELGCGHCTVKRFAMNPPLCSGHSDKGKIQKEAPVSHQTLSHIKREVCHKHLQTCKEVFESTGVPDVPKST